MAKYLSVTLTFLINVIIKALYMSGETILNVYVYVKNKYVSTHLSAPIIYSGKFSWENKLPILISDSINGSSTIFKNIQKVVKSAKSECQMLENMIYIINSLVSENIFADPDQSYTLVYDMTDDSEFGTVKCFLLISLN